MGDLAPRAPRAGYHPGEDPAGEAGPSLKKQGFYHKTAWRRIRVLALQRDRYLCRLRISEKCTGLATEVHHVEPLEQRPDLGLELSNLVSCCWYCHEATKVRGSARPAARPGVRVIVIGGDDAGGGA